MSHSGGNEAAVREAKLRKAYLQKQQEATEDMKTQGEAAVEDARSDFRNMQAKFESASSNLANSMSLYALTYESV